MKVTSVSVPLYYGCLTFVQFSLLTSSKVNFFLKCLLTVALPNCSLADTIAHTSNAILYSLLSACALFLNTWIKVSGSSAYVVAKQLKVWSSFGFMALYRHVFVNIKMILRLRAKVSLTPHMISLVKRKIKKTSVAVISVRVYYYQVLNLVKKKMCNKLSGYRCKSTLKRTT